MSSRTTNLQPIIGRKIQAASSSLRCFTIALDDGHGLLVNAVNAEEPLAAEVVTADKLPEQNEAVCSVDWGWIVGADIRQVRLFGDRLVLDLDPSGPLNVFTGVWQGSPYLAFQPYKPKSG
jgi:hypothetical protein